MCLGIVAVIFLLGVIVGSFLNVCIHRLPQGMSVVRPASHCPSCRTPLRAWDNVPLLSFLALRGRCRYCNIAISWRYPLVEGMNGLAYGLAVVRFGLEPATLVYAWLLSALIVVTFIDLDHQIIPNEVTLPGLPLGLCAAATVLPISWVDSVAGAVVGAGILFVVVWVSPYLFGREGMGMGDVKLLGMLGAFLGWKATLLTLLLGSLSGAVVGIVLMATKRIARSEPIPFGPFLAIGAVLALFFGEELITWYSGLFAVGVMDPR